LNATYERILERVDNTSLSTQKLVHRALKWIICSGTQLPIKALLEAVSVEDGMKSLDPETVPDEDWLLSACSSLIRRTSDATGIELAHSTVKEFFERIDSNGRFGKYKVTPDRDNLDIAKSCLVYLGLDRFDDGDLSAAKFRWRVANFPLFDYAASQWSTHAIPHLKDEGLDHLVKKMFDPSKTNQFMCWSQNWLFTNTESEDMERVRIIGK
jgi:hypothetical protein